MPHINENQNDKEKVYVTELQRQYLDIAREMNNTLVNDEDIERFGDFSRWIFAIDQLSEDFYKPGEDGKYPVMDEISINAFKNTYKRALNECDKVLLSNSDDGVSAKMKEIAARVKKNLLQDSVAFESVEYNENNPLTLDEVIGLGKTITADFGDQKVVAKGAAYSSRIPVKVKGLQGGDLDGFFTPSSYVNPTEQKEKLFEKLESKYPELKDYLDVLKNTPNGKIADTHIESRFHQGFRILFRDQQAF